MEKSIPIRSELIIFFSDQIVVKVWSIKNNTNLNSIFCLVKSSKIGGFFTCILPDYVAHDITKEFWKNSHFENMRVVFLLRCQSWLRWGKRLICHWNSWRQNLFFGCVMVPKIIKISSRYNAVNLVRTKTIRGAILVKIENFYAWKCIISGVFHRSKFWHLRRKSAVIFLKWLFFQNSLLMSWAT